MLVHLPFESLQDGLMFRSSSNCYFGHTYLVHELRFKTALAIDLLGKDCRSHNHGGTECDDGVGEMHFGIEKGRKSGGRFGLSFFS